MPLFLHTNVQYVTSHTTNTRTPPHPPFAPLPPPTHSLQPAYNPTVLVRQMEESGIDVPLELIDVDLASQVRVGSL